MGAVSHAGAGRRLRSWLAKSIVAVLPDSRLQAKAAGAMMSRRGDAAR